MKAFLRPILITALMLPPICGIAQDSLEESELAFAFGGEELISIATGAKQRITRAPAVASLITAEDIQAMGAIDLDQVLETVPGLHVSNSTRAYNSIYSIRGIYSETNPQVLVLVNNIPVTNVFVGDRSQVWGGMPVKNIARIEVIRGPGSAVHGADAFSGTINIVTKTATDINGTEFGVRQGSFNSSDAWVLHGGKMAGFDGAFSMEISQTDGHDETISADAQTSWDQVFFTSASLAPGPVNLQRKNLDTRLDLSQGNWRARLGYLRRNNVGTGAGVAQALDPAGSSESVRINADITYNDDTVLEDWDWTTQLSIFDTNAKSDLVLYPSGAFGGAFPYGVIGNPDVYERHSRFSISGFYRGLDQHKLRVGAGYNVHDMYKIKESKNFTPAGAPLGSIVDVSGDPANVFIRPQERNVFYVSVQDEWSVAPDWDLTGGIRYDDYSDFGTTINPRLALVWQSKYNLTSKLLYGRAFRAPSFAELYNINNPVALGNPDLDPETIDTVEIAFDYHPAKNLRTNINLYNYKIRDIIRTVADPAPATTITAQNTGDQTGYGLEWEAVWKINNAWDLKGNFAYQIATDVSSNTDVANVPGYQAYIQADWKVRPGWNFNAQTHLIAERKRAAGDARPEVADNTETNLTLRHEPSRVPWKFTLSIHNLFDEDVREPTLAPGLIPNDLPLAGRSIMLEAIYRLASY